MPKKILNDMVPGRAVKKTPIKSSLSNSPSRSSSSSSRIPDAPPIKTEEPKIYDKTATFLSELPSIKHSSNPTYRYDEGLCEVEVADKKSSGNHGALWVIALISIVFCFFAFSSIFAKARVTVDPKTEVVPLNHDFSAFKDSNSEGVLPFSLVSLSDEETKTIVGSEEKDAAETAKGKVVLYNNFSTSPQKLAINTRLIGTNGKIYKTETEVTIPGLLKADPKKGIKENVPGSIETQIYASQAGADYNTSPIDFNVLGFQGTNKYQYFYGRSKGDISGGLVGRFNFISPAEKEQAEGELKTALESKLLKKVSEQIPEGYVLLPNATIFRIDDKDTKLFSKEKEVPFVLRGTLYGFLFEEKSLTKKIIQTVIPDYDNSDAYIANIKELKFAAAIPAVVVSYLNIKDIDFSLSGTPKIIWKVDEAKLKDALVGRPKKDFNQILSKFTNIDKANLVLNPVWRKTIPSASKDIKVLVNE